jgi:microcystin-dependent protein
MATKGVINWSKTAATNATADSTVNYAEGQAPSSLNDSARAAMASIASWRDDISGGLTTGGSSTAYTVTLNQNADALSQIANQIITIIPHVTNGADPTLSVNGLTAKPIRSATGVYVSSGTMVAATPYQLVYFSSAGEFILMGFTANPFNIPIGGGMIYLGSTAPNSSFAFPYGQAISRSTYSTLFSQWGTSSGTGDGSTTFNLPDFRGRVPAGLDNMGGSSANRLTGVVTSMNGDTPGATGGDETITVAQANLPNVNFTVSGITLNDPLHGHPFRIDTAGDDNTETTGGFCVGLPGTNFSAFTGTTPTANNGEQIGGSTSGVTVSNQGSAASGGSGTAISIVQPTIVVPYVIRII